MVVAFYPVDPALTKDAGTLVTNSFCPIWNNDPNQGFSPPSTMSQKGVLGRALSISPALSIH